MADALTGVVVALAAFLGFGEVESRSILKGDIVTTFPDPSSPGEVVGNVLLVIDAPWESVASRLEIPARQPGVLAGGNLNLDHAESVDRFLRDARLDDDDPERLRSCRPGDCRLKMTQALMDAQRDLPERATNQARVQAHLRALAGLSRCGLDRSCDLTLVEKRGPVSLAPVARRLSTQRSLAQLLSGLPSPPLPARIEWRTEGYWKREVLSLGRVHVLEGRFADHRALLHRREMVFGTHYFEGARVETLFVEAGGRIVVAQANDFQTDKTSGFNWLERTLIRRLGRGRFESQAREWRQETRRRP